MLALENSSTEVVLTDQRAFGRGTVDLIPTNCLVACYSRKAGRDWPEYLTAESAAEIPGSKPSGIRIPILLISAGPFIIGLRRS